MMLEVAERYGVPPSVMETEWTFADYLEAAAHISKKNEEHAEAVRKARAMQGRR